MITATAAPMTATLQLRQAHIRPAPHSTRACPCCVKLRPRDVTRIRRADRRQTRQELRNASPDA